jgi:hypothetical protein
VRLGLLVFAPIAFIGSCIAMIPPALHLTDSMTHVALDDAVQTPFPVVVVNGDQARVVMTETPRDVPPPPAGASFLIPLDQVERVERQLREQDTVHRDSPWVLRVKQISPDRQKIELFLSGDGFRGGVYEATANTVIAQYRKVTGPGFAFVFGPVAIALRYCGVYCSRAYGSSGAIGAPPNNGMHRLVIPDRSSAAATGCAALRTVPQSGNSYASPGPGSYVSRAPVGDANLRSRGSRASFDWANHQPSCEQTTDSEGRPADGGSLRLDPDPCGRVDPQTRQVRLDRQRMESLRGIGDEANLIRVVDRVDEVLEGASRLVPRRVSIRRVVDADQSARSSASRLTKVSPEGPRVGSHHDF